MAKRSQPEQGSWLLAEEYYDRGDPAFVDELRRLSNPDRLATFAPKWYADRRPAARRLLLDYLDRPLNAYRHEPLVKRIFKAAETAGDDEMMGAFLVAFDRSIRRVRKVKSRYDWQTRESWTEETITIGPKSTLPRTDNAFYYRDPQTGDRLAAPSRKLHDRLRLFSLRTRRYLRRRSWRYFRNLGKQHPDRYRAAMVATLARYTDDDVADGLALIDNWGLIHALFHHTPALVANASGWFLVEGKSLAELQPAPAFPEVWKADAAPLITLVKTARCRPVRQWALQLLRQHHPNAFAKLPLRELIQFLSHDDLELAELAAEALRNSPELSRLTVDDWLRLLDQANPQMLDAVCELMTRQLDGRSLNLEQLVKLAGSRPMPVAHAGFTWLQTRRPETEAECRLLLGLADGECVALRPAMIGWLATTLGASPHFRSDWILELLDSRHADVREAGWAWFVREPRASQDWTLWQKLMESPYDDLRLNVVAMLEQRTLPKSGSNGQAVSGPVLLPSDRGRLDPDMLRLLWATVLLNIHRGSRTKPRVAAQIVARLERHPDEAAKLLPVLAAALRSVRGPEWRTGLAALIQLVERRPELEPVVQREFPELRLSAT